MKQIIYISLFCLYIKTPTQTITEPKIQQSPKFVEKKILVETVLLRALVFEKDIPDYWLIKDKKNIVLSNIIRPEPVVHPDEKIDTLSAALIPKLEKIKLSLMTPLEIQQRAEKKGDFIYIEFNKIEIGKNIARIAISTKWAISKKTKIRVILSGGGHEHEYIKNENKWIFKKSVVSWNS